MCKHCNPLADKTAKLRLLASQQVKLRQQLTPATPLIDVAGPLMQHVSDGTFAVVLATGHIVFKPHQVSNITDSTITIE